MLMVILVSVKQLLAINFDDYSLDIELKQLDNH